MKDLDPTLDSTVTIIMTDYNILTDGYRFEFGHLEVQSQHSSHIVC